MRYIFDRIKSELSLSSPHYLPPTRGNLSPSPHKAHSPLRVDAFSKIFLSMGEQMRGEQESSNFQNGLIA